MTQNVKFRLSLVSALHLAVKNLINVSQGGGLKLNECWARLWTSLGFKRRPAQAVGVSVDEEVDLSREGELVRLGEACLERVSRRR